MDLEQMREVVNTFDYMINLICNNKLSYEQAKSKLKAADGKVYSISFVSEEDDMLYVDIGLVNFIIHKTENGGFYIEDQVLYYIPHKDEAGNIITYEEEPVAINLPKEKGVNHEML